MFSPIRLETNILSHTNLVLAELFLSQQLLLIVCIVLCTGARDKCLKYTPFLQISLSEEVSQQLS